MVGTVLTVALLVHLRAPSSPDFDRRDQGLQPRVRVVPRAAAAHLVEARLVAVREARGVRVLGVEEAVRREIGEGFFGGGRRGVVLDRDMQAVEPRGERAAAGGGVAQ